jgi:Stage II sporulation protein E (SpoIIE)
LGLVIGDVTDKGIPAALVMTATRTMLRTAARETTSPGEVLARVNDLLYEEIPAKMFVTCFYAILDPASGHISYANAGHDLPYCRQKEGVSELWATGMPLGLMPGSCYDEHEITVAPGENLLFYTDGLVEAHNPNHEMFSFPRLKTLLAAYPDGTSLIDLLLNELKSFTGEGWEQEDDVTLVTLQRAISSEQCHDDSVLHETIPSDKLGRVISLDTLGSFGMIPVGELLGGILTDRIGPALVFIVFGLFNLINVLIPLLVREVRELE